MLCRPFRAVFALIISYGNFDLPQNLFVDLADRRAEGCHRARGVEIKDAEKILVFKVILRLHPAAGHEGVGDADRSGVFERHLDVVIIILLQVRIRNDAEDVAGMVAPVFRSKLGSDALELLREAVFAGNAVITLQHGAHAVRSCIPSCAASDSHSLDYRRLCKGFETTALHDASSCLQCF